MSHLKREKPIDELVSDLSDELRSLIRNEAVLARTEFKSKFSAAGRDFGSLAAGGAVLYAGFLAVLGAVVLLFGGIMPLWLSALIFGLLAVGAGYYLVRKGIEEIRHFDITPHETISSLKEDRTWLRRVK